MKTAVWLRVAGRKTYGRWGAGQVQAFKSKPSTLANQLAIRLELEIPDAYFETPEIKAVVTLPEPAGRETIAAGIERGVAEALTRELGVTVRLASDDGRPAALPLSGPVGA